MAFSAVATFHMRVYLALTARGGRAWPVMIPAFSDEPAEMQGGKAVCLRPHGQHLQSQVSGSETPGSPPQAKGHLSNTSAIERAGQLASGMQPGGWR